MNAPSSRPRLPSALGGFSLVEVLLVLGIMATLMTAAFVVYPRVHGSNVAHQTVNQWFKVRESLPMLADPSGLEAKINQAVPVEGINWKLRSDGKGSWETTVVFTQNQRTCERFAYALVSEAEPTTVNGETLTHENAHSACNGPLTTFSVAFNPAGPVAEYQPAVATAVAEPPAKDTVETVDVDIYANQGPGQREKWNEAGGF